LLRQLNIENQAIRIILPQRAQETQKHRNSRLVFQPQKSAKITKFDSLFSLRLLRLFAAMIQFRLRSFRFPSQQKVEKNAAPTIFPS